MATVTGLTAERMLAIEAASVVDGEVLADHLILTKHDGTQIDAGSVVGPAGPTGPAGSALSVLNAAGVLEPGISGQKRAGRVLTVADFTTLLGLSTPGGLFNLGSVANLGSGGALVNKGVVTFGKGITGSAAEAAVFTGSTAQALYVLDTGAADPFRLAYGSVGCWFKTDKRGVYQGLVSKWTAAASNYLLEISSTNVLYARAYAGASVAVTGLTDVCDGRWHHVVFTWDGTTFSLYLDGVLETSVVTTGQYGPMNVGVAPFNIGGAAADAGTITADPNWGRIDEVFVTQDVLHESQVRMLYAAKIAHGATFTPSRVDLMIRRLRKGGALLSGAFSTAPLHLYNFTAGALTDAGSLLNALTNNGGALASPGVDGVQNSAIEFNGTTQYLSATDAGLPAGTTARSMGCWFKTLIAGSGSLMQYGTASATNDYFIWINSTGNIVLTMGTQNVVTPGVYNDGQWHFVVAVVDPAASDGLLYKIYVDGKLAFGYAAALNATVLGGANKFRIGANLSGAVFFAGSIDAAFVTGYALSSDDVALLYASGSLSLGTSPKNVGDHVERLDATNIYMIFDTLESQNQIDLQVAS